MDSSKYKVTLIGSPERSSHGSVIIESWSSQERLVRALKVFGLLLGLGGISILIPLAHFILVPSFLLAAPIVARHVYKSDSMIVGGNGPCPHCQKLFEIAKSSVRWPLSDVCASCHSAVSISLSESQE